MASDLWRSPVFHPTYLVDPTFRVIVLLSEAVHRMIASEKLFLSLSINTTTYAEEFRKVLGQIEC